MPLHSRLPQIAANLRPRLDGAVREGARRVASDAKSRVPVQSGDLRDAIHVEHGDDLSYKVVAGDRSVFYGHLVEFGTAHSPAQPFLIPALEATKRGIRRDAKRAIEDA